MNRSQKAALTKREAKEAQRRLRRILRNMLSVWPFFGQLALRLPLNMDNSRKTIASDGTALYYNTDWVIQTSDDQIREAISGLVIACGLKHHTRRRGRDYGKWQWASKQVRQPFLDAAGLSDPGLHPGLDMSIEKAYLQAPDDDTEDQNEREPEGQPQSQDGTGQGEIMDFVPSDDTKDESGEVEAQGGGGQGGEGEGADDGSDESQAPPQPSPAQQVQEQEQEWDKALEMAKHIDQQTKSRGNTPGNLVETIEAMHVHQVDWRELLRRFMDSHDKSDYTWSRPNRRHIHHGLYLPSAWGESMDEIVFAVDTSGSMSERELSAVWTEIRAAANEINPKSVIVMQCDHALQEVKEYRIGELPEKITVKGRGGTSFEPVFAEMENRRPPACLIYMTDMMGKFPKDAPGYPVMWIDTYGYNFEQNAPFGEVIKLKMDEEDAA